MKKNIVNKFTTTLLLMMLTSALFAAIPSVMLQTATVTNPYPLAFTVNVTFSEPITGLSPADINVTNGTVTSITGLDCQSNYVVTIQPNAAGAMSISIPANTVVSVSTGQSNLASNILNITGFIPAKPSVTLQTATVTNPYPLTFTVNVTFSEPITGLSPVDINVTNGTVASITGLDCQPNYVVTIQPNATGAMSISIPANAVVSVSTGQPNLASNILNITGLIPTKPPASNFDLKNWSLTLPLPLGSKYNAISIGQVTLNGTPNFDNGYTKAPYFFTDPISGSMNFFAPLNGATTPGSEFSRTELYEILPGVSPYWKLSTFASNTLTGTLLVKAVPPTTKRMVIGQIHDKGNTDSLGHKASNSPFVKLYYDKDFVDPNNSAPCNGCVYAQIRTTPAQSNFLKIVRLINNIPLNTIFTYKITILRNGTLTITANNVSTTIMVNTSSDNTIGWGTQQLYFKAGVYNLEFGSSNTLGGAVSYYSLQVEHA